MPPPFAYLSVRLVPAFSFIAAMASVSDTESLAHPPVSPPNAAVSVDSRPLSLDDVEEWDADQRQGRFRNFAWYSTMLQLVLSIFAIAAYGSTIRSKDDVVLWGSDTMGWLVLGVAVALFVFAVVGILGVWRKKGYFVVGGATVWYVIAYVTQHSN